MVNVMAMKIQSNWNILSKMKMLGWNLKAGLSYINARYLRLKGGQETIARQQIVTHNFHPLSPIQVMVVPILQDNFSYIIAHPRTSSAAIIDCGDAFPLLDIIRASQLNVTDILTTHHHADHCAGNEDLLKAFPTATIYGWDTRTAKLTHLIQPGDKLKVSVVIKLIHYTMYITFSSLIQLSNTFPSPSPHTLFLISPRLFIYLFIPLYVLRWIAFLCLAEHASSC